MTGTGRDFRAVREEMVESTEQIMGRLIARQAVAVVHVRTEGGGVQFQATFLKEGEREGDRGAWVRQSGAAPPLLDRLIRSATPVLVKIDDGRWELSFVSSLLLRQKSLLAGERLLLAWPGVINTKELRQSPRERLAHPAPIAAALIKGGKENFPGLGLPLQVWDISIHGACLIAPAGFGLRLSRGDQLEIRLALRGAEHRVAARHCRTETLPSGHQRFGIEFLPGAVPEPLATQLQGLVEQIRAERERRLMEKTMVKGTW
jgi:hypothetical protein